MATVENIFSPYTSLISPDIGWFSGVTGPGRTMLALDGKIYNDLGPSAPTKLWRDDTGIGPAPPFGLFDTFSLSSASPTRTYKFIARDSAGKPKLTPIGSQQFFATYGSSISVVNTYTSRSFRFPGGVPYLEDLTLPTEVATKYNGQGTSPAIDYPITLPDRGDKMLVPVGGEVMVCNYQDFIRVYGSLGKGLTDDEKVAKAKEILSSSLSSADKITTVRNLFIQDAPVAPPI